MIINGVIYYTAWSKFMFFTLQFGKVVRNPLVQWPFLLELMHFFEFISCLSNNNKDLSKMPCLILSTFLLNVHQTAHYIVGILPTFPNATQLNSVSSIIEICTCMSAHKLVYPLPFSWGCLFSTAHMQLSTDNLLLSVFHYLSIYAIHNEFNSQQMWQPSSQYC